MTMRSLANQPPALDADRPSGRRSATSSEPPAAVKPLLRGVSHQIACLVALVATVWLVNGCATRARAVAVGVFGASLIILFGTSALYHRINWSTAGRRRMRRMDHAAIFLLTGGGYTPLFALVDNPDGSRSALIMIWLGASVGVVKSLAWANAPKWVTALVCLVIGWMGIVQVFARLPVVGATCVGLLFAGGVTFSLGAAVYALKRPNPWPRVFGYHEIFHLLVIVASGFILGHVVYVLRALA